MNCIKLISIFRDTKVVELLYMNKIFYKIQKFYFSLFFFNF